MASLLDAGYRAFNVKFIDAGTIVIVTDRDGIFVNVKPIGVKAETLLPWSSTRTFSGQMLPWQTPRSWIAARAARARSASSLPATARRCVSAMHIDNMPCFFTIQALDMYDRRAKYGL